MRTLNQLLLPRPSDAGPVAGPVGGPVAGPVGGPVAGPDARPGPGLSGAEPAAGEVSAWGGRATVSVEDRSALTPALRLARHHLRAVAQACDRRDPAAQVHRLAAAGGARLAVSPLLLRHVQAALETAAVTDGLVDPTVVTDRRSGSAPSVPVCSQRPGPRAARGWRSVQVAGSAVQVPGGTALDLTAFALPMALDDLARVITQLTGTGVRVRLHGRTAWCDSSGRGGGTAGTDGLRVVDPRTGSPAAWRWSWVEVSADSARAASALAVAAVVRGEDAPTWLDGRCRSARLVGSDGTVTLVGRPAAGPAGPRPSLRSTSAA